MPSSTVVTDCYTKPYAYVAVLNKDATQAVATFNKGLMFNHLVMVGTEVARFDKVLAAKYEFSKHNLNTGYYAIVLQVTSESSGTVLGYMYMLYSFTTTI